MYCPAGHWMYTQSGSCIALQGSWCMGPHRVGHVLPCRAVGVWDHTGRVMYCPAGHLVHGTHRAGHVLPYKAMGVQGHWRRVIYYPAGQWACGGTEGGACIALEGNGCAEPLKAGHALPCRAVGVRGHWRQVMYCPAGQLVCRATEGGSCIKKWTLINPFLLYGIEVWHICKDNYIHLTKKCLHGHL